MLLLPPHAAFRHTKTNLSKASKYRNRAMICMCLGHDNTQFWIWHHFRSCMQLMVGIQSICSICSPLQHHLCPPNPVLICNFCRLRIVRKLMIEHHLANAGFWQGRHQINFSKIIHKHLPEESVFTSCLRMYYNIISISSVQNCNRSSNSIPPPSKNRALRTHFFVWRMPWPENFAVNSIPLWASHVTDTNIQIHFA